MRNKRPLLLVGGIALAVALVALWWFGAQKLPLTSSPTSLGRSEPSRPMVSVPSSSSAPGESLSAQPEVAGTQTKEEVPRDIAEAIGRVTNQWRSVEESNSTMLFVVERPEMLAAIALVTEPTVDQIGRIASAVTSELERFDSDSKEYRDIRESMEALYAEYVQFGSPEKTVIAKYNKKTSAREYWELIGGDENSMKFDDDGRFEINRGKFRSVKDAIRYEHLFAKAAEEAGKAE